MLSACGIVEKSLQQNKGKSLSFPLVGLNLLFAWQSENRTITANSAVTRADIGFILSDFVVVLMKLLEKFKEKCKLFNPSTLFFVQI
jgi:hypothetical protein